ncbi:MAG: hypothetical protein ACSLFR_09670 [Solirubrobacteraceae bacterium]
MALQNITGMTVLSISAPFWGLVAGLGAQQRRERFPRVTTAAKG